MDTRVWMLFVHTLLDTVWPACPQCDKGVNVISPHSITALLASYRVRTQGEWFAWAYSRLASQHALNFAQPHSEHWVIRLLYVCLKNLRWYGKVWESCGWSCNTVKVLHASAVHWVHQYPVPSDVPLHTVLCSSKCNPKGPKLDLQKNKV